MSNLTPLAQVLRLQGWGAQRKLARKIGLSESELSRIVNGRTQAGEATRERIAHGMGRDVAELFPPKTEQEAA